MINDLKNIDSESAKSWLKILISNNKYDHDEILMLSDNIYQDCHGISYFDAFIIKLIIKKLTTELKRPLNILEIGCGTSSRVMKNLNQNIKTYALSDDHARPLVDFGLTDFQPYDFNTLDVFEYENLLVEEFKNCDLFFLDGDHSLGFAKYIYENIVLKSENKKYIIAHDFNAMDSKFKYLEQYYVVIKFLTDKTGYKLLTYTSLDLTDLKEIETELESGFMEYYNTGYQCDGINLPPSCLAIMN